MKSNPPMKITGIACARYLKNTPDGTDAFNHFVEAQLVWDEGMRKAPQFISMLIQAAEW